MILSVSRRTDIPAFYGKWFINRLREGMAKTRNPFNPNQIREILLTPEEIDCIVFWTKNPLPFFQHLKEITEIGYKFYFLYTITPYDKTIETKVPPLAERVSTFKKLSETIGQNKVIWRYDPILFTDQFNKDFHLEQFDELAKQLNGYTSKCIISFLSNYQKTKRNLLDIKIINPTDNEKVELTKKLNDIANGNNITLQSCASDLELGILHGACIDKQLIEEIIGRELSVKRDKHQRGKCQCVKSVDIGVYNTCPHNCLYCYANNNIQISCKKYKEHNPDSVFLY